MHGAVDAMDRVVGPAVHRDHAVAEDGDGEVDQAQVRARVAAFGPGRHGFAGRFGVLGHGFSAWEVDSTREARESSAVFKDQSTTGHVPSIVVAVLGVRGLEPNLNVATPTPCGAQSRGGLTLVPWACPGQTLMPTWSSQHIMASRLVVVAGVLLAALGLCPWATATPESDLLTRLGTLGGGQEGYLETYPTLAIAKSNAAARLQVDTTDNEVNDLTILVAFLERHADASLDLASAAAGAPDHFAKIQSAYDEARTLLDDLRGSRVEEDNVDLALVATQALLGSIGEQAHQTARADNSLPTALRLDYLELSVNAYLAASNDGSVRDAVQAELDDLRADYERDMGQADQAVASATAMGDPPSNSLPNLMTYYATAKLNFDRLQAARATFSDHREADRLANAADVSTQLGANLDQAQGTLMRSLAPYLLGSILLCAWAVRATLAWRSDVRVAGLGTELQVV